MYFVFFCSISFQILAFGASFPLHTLSNETYCNKILPNMSNFLVDIREGRYLSNLNIFVVFTIHNNNKKQNYSDEYSSVVCVSVFRIKTLRKGGKISSVLKLPHSTARRTQTLPSLEHWMRMRPECHKDWLVQGGNRVFFNLRTNSNSNLAKLWNYKYLLNGISLKQHAANRRSVLYIQCRTQTGFCSVQFVVGRMPPKRSHVLFSLLVINIVLAL